MNIEEKVPWHVIADRVRQTPLLEQFDDQTIYPYRDADIDLRWVTYNSVRPTTLYVLQSNLALLGQVAAELSASGHHPLDLDSGLVLRDADATHNLFPPIVEETPEAGAYLLDGAHRTYNGRQAGRSGFMAIYISGIDPRYPAYAHPNDWSDIDVVERVPSDPSRKKRYREGNYRRLYRDFGMLNGSHIRNANDS